MCRSHARTFALLILFSLGTVGCGGARLGEGSARWSRIDTAHFAVYTDVDRDTAERFALDTERWLSAFLQHGWGGARELGARMNIVLFARERDFERHAGTSVSGYYVPSVLLEPWLVMPARELRDSRVLRHELTHAIAFQAIRTQPSWYAEGLAGYFETAVLDEDGEFTVGSAASSFARVLVTQGRIPAAQLFADEGDLHTYQFYASAWLVVHYLMSERAEAFESYQRALARGASHDEAWREAFENTSAQALDQELTHYFLQGSYPTFRSSLAVPDFTAQVSTLTVADERALEGVLWTTGCDGCSEQTRLSLIKTSFEGALAADPRQLHVSVGMLLDDEHPSGETVAVAKRLVLDHPDAPLAWITLGLASMGAGQLDAAHADPDPVAKLQKIAPHHPYTWMLAAYQHANEGEQSAAIRAAAKATRLSPRNPAVLMLGASLFARLSACTELKQTLVGIDLLEHARPVAMQLAEFRAAARACSAAH